MVSKLLKQKKQCNNKYSSKHNGKFCQHLSPVTSKLYMSRFAKLHCYGVGLKNKKGSLSLIESDTKYMYTHL